MIAAETYPQEVVAKLIKRGAHVNYADSVRFFFFFFFFYLYIRCRPERFRIGTVRLNIVFVFVSEKQGNWSALHAATRYGQLENAKLQLEAKAKVNLRANTVRLHFGRLLHGPGSFACSNSFVCRCSCFFGIA